MAKLYTAVELSKDGTRTVYHSKIEPNEIGWAWTHPETKKERAKCTACTKGTLDSAKKIAKQVERGAS